MGTGAGAGLRLGAVGGVAASCNAEGAPVKLRRLGRARVRCCSSCACWSYVHVPV
jgi:hypothetical protein